MFRSLVGESLEFVLLGAELLVRGHFLLKMHISDFQNVVSLAEIFLCLDDVLIDALRGESGLLVIGELGKSLTFDFLKRHKEKAWAKKAMAPLPGVVGANINKEVRGRLEFGLKVLNNYLQNSEDYFSNLKKL